MGIFDKIKKSLEDKREQAKEDKINSDPYHAKSNDSENHVDLLEKLNSFTLSGEVILAFNSIRSIMKHSKPVQKRRAIYHINNIKRLIGE